MENKVNKLQMTLLGLYTIMALYIFGIVYELSFFITLGADGVYLLGWKQFIYSGFFHGLIFPTIMAIIALFTAWIAMLLSSLKVFFSKEVYLNKSITERFDEINRKPQGNRAKGSAGGDSFLLNYIPLARVFFLLNFGIWITTIILFQNGYSTEWNFIIIGFAFSLPYFCDIFIIIYCGKKRLAMMLNVALFSGTFLASALGITDAAQAISEPSKNIVVRDDSIVLIERQENSYIVNVKKTPLPFLFGKLID
ncbi:hypothetical protein GCM10009007_11660 [Formosimonas limnophila]|uniref:Uncharacterized protein n=1 Tax=Formosimonas limnophila TaxID=1384487 RepID=A0A8J3CN42_9BURK|nr:hypothetical protein [Formosimonas limnophila]GHA72347.1 hypothetical protein GCM10009007_11660 [Formosimonas limnophila]